MAASFAGPCSQCSCLHGHFINPTSTCINCSHDRGKHSKGDPVFSVGATYLIGRSDMVEQVTEILLRHRIIVIRAPPMAGKSTLLDLLGEHIYRNCLHLEPIKVVWPKHRRDRTIPKLYKFFLQDCVEECRLERIKKPMRSIRARHLFSLTLATGLCYYLQHVLQIHSPLQHLLHVRWLLCAMWFFFIQLHPLAKCVVKYALSSGYDHNTVFLIDNAHETYRESRIWEDLFKNDPVETDPYFVLMCEYGSADAELTTWGFSLSAASKIPPERRVELHPSVHNYPQMLLSSQELRSMLDIWGKKSGTDIKVLENSAQYIEFETQGHVGVVTRVLQYLQRAIKDVISSYRCNVIS